MFYNFNRVREGADDVCIGGLRREKFSGNHYIRKLSSVLRLLG